MRISDWSSDVCSSDLARFYGTFASALEETVPPPGRIAVASPSGGYGGYLDRKSAGLGKRVLVRVGLGGSRIIQKKKTPLPRCWGTMYRAATPYRTIQINTTYAHIITPLTTLQS